MSYKICFIEEEFSVSGGMRRIIEMANGLQAKGHEVTILLSLNGVSTKCEWMEVKAKVKRWDERDEYDIAIMNHAPVWPCMESIFARLKVYYWLGFEAAYFRYPTWQDAYKKPYYIIANSDWTADMAKLIYGKRPPVNYGGIDSKLFHPVKVKKEYELLCCCPEDKPEKGWFELKRAADILQLPIVNFATKNLPQEKLAEEYSKAKIFLASPLVEGFYFPTLEAMACGVPVIMTDCGGNRSYAKNNENCLIVPRNAGAFAEAIYLLQIDKELQNKFIKNGVITANQFTWRKCIDGFEKLLIKAYGDTNLSL